MLRAVGVELQGIEALWCARNLSFDVPTQQTVGHVWAVADGQDLHRGQVGSAATGVKVPPPPPQV